MTICLLAFKPGLQSSAQRRDTNGQETQEQMVSAIHPSYTFMKLKHAKTLVVLCLCSHCIFYAKCPYSESCLQMLVSVNTVLTFCRGKRETRSSHLLKNSF